MTVKQIMASKTIISSVPHKVKAQAIKNTLENGLTNMVSATMLKEYDDWYLFIDQNSVSGVDIDKYL